MVMIEIDQVSKTYGQTVVLTVDQWRLSSCNCVLAGQNGAGKTTLLLMLAGLEHPTRGTVRIDGHRAGSRSARAVVSFAPDQPALFDDLTIADQMTYVARLHGLAKPYEVADELVERLGAQALLGRFGRGMSKGQRQTAGLLVATSRPFEVLLLDEPTTGLDTRSRAGLIEVVQGLAERGCTVISSTHDPDLLAAADTTVRIADGALKA
jgi:ABC-type multidrug transport system ATPase subunit